MPTGIGTAALIAGIAGAGASAGGAAIQAHAAKNAAKTQAQSADEALRLNQRVYDDQMRMVSPYVQFGTQSLGNLGRLSATPFSEQTSGMVSAARGGGGIPNFQQGMSNPAQGISLGQIGMAGMGQPGGGGMVQLRAPDGVVRPFPAARAQAMLMQHPELQRVS